jgi:hypothetical protein
MFEFYVFVGQPASQIADLVIPLYLSQQLANALAV